MTLHVFAGPSMAGSPELEHDDVCSHPPIAHGDLYRVHLAPEDSVLIVDGVYQHTAPVRHKEILHFYAQGVSIYGAASLGALRACEHLGHGMTGLGTVFAWYRDGRLMSDADVALTHGDSEIAFRGFTHAIVSILHVTDQLVAQDRLDADTAARVVALARSVHFTVRSRGALLASVHDDELGAAVQLVIDELHPDRTGDVKRMDAEQAVRDIRSEAAGAPPKHVAVPVTAYQKEWQLQHTSATADADSPSLRQVLAQVQLFIRDFPDRHTRYVLAHLRPEYPQFAVTEPASNTDTHRASWLDALSATDLVERGILTSHEAEHLNERERTVRVLVRTFRRQSGRLVFEEMPNDLHLDLPEKAAQSARLLGLSHQAMRLNPRFHPGDIPNDLLDSTFADLWQVDDVATHVLDRGFRSTEDFRENARPYFIAARAFIAMRDERNPPEIG
ncbi:TfuA-like protein [Aeromicrobium sp. CF3.5]|uniref:TfuA-like protein n=1 Tax=Aeromicrobium sp. CF3.5 TaxID=3373078 RepID=UPI003EE6A86B